MRTFLVCALLFTAGPALAAPAPKPGTTGDAAEVADKLMEKIDFERIQNTGLRAVLDTFQEKTGVTVLLDYQPITGAVGLEAGGLDEMAVNVHAMKGVRGETVLKHIAKQVDAVLYYHSDHVLLTTPMQMAKMAGLSRGVELLVTGVHPDEETDDPVAIVKATSYVTANYRDVPLADALRSVSQRANRTAVVAADVIEKAKATVSASLANVPFEVAVSTLAEAAGLRAVRNGNTVLVVTQARAKELAETDRKLMIGLGGGNLGGGTYLTLEDLQAIAKLFPGKADPEAVQKEVNRLRAEKVK
jgi:hypothetical protein